MSAVTSATGPLGSGTSRALGNALLGLSLPHLIGDRTFESAPRRTLGIGQSPRSAGLGKRLVVSDRGRKETYWSP